MPDGHIHDSVIQGSVIFGWVLAFGLIWNLVKVRKNQSAIGKAMSLFY
jgi:hypothetical protein